MSPRSLATPLLCALVLLAPCALAQAPSDNELYVRRLYQDLLGRPIDLPGQNFASALTQGVLTRAQVADLVLSSQEHGQRQVVDFFRQYLERDPVPTEVAGLFPQLANPGYDTVRLFILGSSEYFLDAGSSNQGFLDSLYHDVLGRPIDAAGISAFLPLLTGGTPRTQIANQVLNSTESHQRLIDGYYQQYLHRPADPAAINSFLPILNGGANDPAVIVPILSSNEYFQNALPEPAALTLLAVSAAFMPRRRAKAVRPAL
jgi:hypothetical protein